MVRTTRLNEFVQDLLNTGRVRNKSDIAKILGEKNLTGLGDLQRGKKTVRLEHIIAACKEFPEYSKEWLEGENVPMKGNFKRVEKAYPVADETLQSGDASEGSPQSGAELREVGNLATTMIPYLDMAAQAGMAAGYVSSWRLENLQEVRVALTDTMRGVEQMVMVDIVGESMMPHLLPGDQAICELLPRSKWKSLPPNIYIFVLEDQIVAKQLRKNTFGSEKLELFSSNPIYPPAQIESVKVQSVLRILEMRRAFPKLIV